LTTADTCVDELCCKLHRHFEKKWEYVYKAASELAVELILEAASVVPEFQQKAL
jgi:hypothetical protein